MLVKYFSVLLFILVVFVYSAIVYLNIAYFRSREKGNVLGVNDSPNDTG